MRSFRTLIIILLIGGGLWYFYEKGPAARVNAPSAQTAGEFRCAGKIYCSQMTSCDEALFYLQNCPNTQMDGDGDKIPCEKEWCGHRVTNRKNFP